MSKAFYEKYWQNQEELSDFAYKWPIIKKFLPLTYPFKFLDFGCGKGVILDEIQKIRPGYALFACDISTKALDEAQKRIHGAKFKSIGSDQSIPFPNNYFDYILASDVLEHIYDTSTAFLELSRVLKKGGQLFITVPFNGKLKIILATLFAFDQYFHPYSPHIRFFSKSSLEWCAKEASLTPVHFGYFGRFYPLSNGMFIIARK